MIARRSLPQLVLWMLLPALPGAGFLLLLARPDWDQMAVAPEAHFYIVSTVSLVSVVLAVLASVAALRLASVRVLLLALAFISLAAVFSVHGLSTPGILLRAASEAASADATETDTGVADGHYELELEGDAAASADGSGSRGSDGGGPYHIVGFASRMAILLAAAFLAASAIDLPERVSRMVIRARVAIIGLWAAALVAFGYVALRFPAVIPPRIMSEELFLNGTLVAVLALTAFAAVRYFAGFRRSGLPMYGAIAIGSVLMFEAQVSMHLMPVWRYSWWLYHLQLLFSVSAICWGLFIEYARGRSPLYAMEGLTLRDPVEQVRAGYADVVTAFAASLEARDGYTLGHGERVSALAVMIGDEMRLPAGRLRAMAQGALLHDVGKIAIPDSILHKTGKLTADEYAVIQGHPAHGESILAEAFGGSVERAVVRHHHERFDGRGYPDGLAGDAISIEARIVAVADVYDALRSARSYREAWERDEALALIRSEAGQHFDPGAVDAFFAVVDRWEAKFSADHERYAASRYAA